MYNTELETEAHIPRFFFDHCDSHGIARDDEGLDLPDLDTAYLEAFWAATEMWIEALRQVRNPSDERFEIRNAAGAVVLVLPFSEILESGRGAKRRQMPDFSALQNSIQRTRAAHDDLVSQISQARRHLSETKSTLARLQALSPGSAIDRR